MNLASRLSRLRDCGGLLLLAYGSSRSPTGVKGLLKPVGGVSVPDGSLGVPSGLTSRDGRIESPVGPAQNLGVCFGNASVMPDPCDSDVVCVEN